MSIQLGAWILVAAPLAKIACIRLGQIDSVPSEKLRYQLALEQANLSTFFGSSGITKLTEERIGLIQDELSRREKQETILKLLRSAAFEALLSALDSLNPDSQKDSWDEFLVQVEYLAKLCDGLDLKDTATLSVLQECRKAITQSLESGSVYSKTYEERTKFIEALIEKIKTRKPILPSHES